MGTTHADYFMGRSRTRPLSDDEIRGDYETNTGHVIIETLGAQHTDPLSVPAALVHGHARLHGEKIRRTRCIMRWCWRRLPI